MSLALQDRKETAGALTFGAKTEMLKQYEVFSYQIAYYLLQNEADARQAAERTLLALYARCDFFTLPEARRQPEVKSEAIRQSLRLKQGNK